MENQVIMSSHTSNKWTIPGPSNANDLSTCVGATMHAESAYQILVDYDLDEIQYKYTDL